MSEGILALTIVGVTLGTVVAGMLAASTARRRIALRSVLGRRLERAAVVVSRDRSSVRYVVGVIEGRDRARLQRALASLPDTLAPGSLRRGWHGDCARNAFVASAREILDGPSGDIRAEDRSRLAAALEARGLQLHSVRVALERPYDVGARRAERRQVGRVGYLDVTSDALHANGLELWLDATSGLDHWSVFEAGDFGHGQRLSSSTLLDGGWTLEVTEDRQRYELIRFEELAPS